jgi:alkyl sulfatase BDS1-like metallo-beta-lactamase superfamily hydrolase
MLRDSFEPDDSQTRIGPRGQIGHRALLEHSTRLRRGMTEARPGVWSLMGVGLPNHTFILAPEGVIVIDTNDSVEAMRDALREFRQHCNAPIAAVIYTHFHYVTGTTALLEDTGGRAFPIWAHERVQSNRLRLSGELGPRASRGLVHQFGTALPADGPDAIINLGCGMALREPAHAPFTQGWLPPTNTFGEETVARIAGLEVHLIPAPSDADDSITIWLPALGVCVNNLVWPALFNVFPIRGEEYRDPRILMHGLDRILALAPEYLLGAHGPVIAGRAAVQEAVTDYRDAIQYLWDQTVRALNKGLGGAELSYAIHLPPRFRRSYLTQQLYGLAEHHVRQIASGLVGWWDEDPASLFPLEPMDHARRLIDGFGGPAKVRALAEDALACNDLRWALELSGWLVKSHVNGARQSGFQGDTRADQRDTDERLQARVLRLLGQRTAASNIRSWVHTRALELEGSIDLARTRSSRLQVAQVLSQPPAAYVATLRVLLDPERAEGVDCELRWEFEEGARCGLRVRGLIAVPTDGSQAQAAIRLSHACWADLLARKRTLGEALADGSISVDGDTESVRRFFGCFEHPTLSQ